MRLMMLISLALLLAACAVSPAIPSDPYFQLEMSDAVAQRARASIKATDQFLTGQGQHAAAVSTRVAVEVYGTAIALQARQTEVALAATQIAPTDAAATAGMEAVLRATDIFLTQTPAAATTQALASAIEVQRAQGQRAQALAWVVPAAILIVALGVAMGLAWSFREWTNWRIHQEQILTGVRESRSGPLIFDFRNNTWVLLQDAALVRRLSMAHSEIPTIPMVELSPGGVTATSSKTATGPRDGQLELAQRLLIESIDKFGEEANRIVPANVSALPSHEWKAAKEYLEARGAVETRERVGTYVKPRLGALGWVLHALETDGLTLTTGSSLGRSCRRGAFDPTSPSSSLSPTPRGNGGGR